MTDPFYTTKDSLQRSIASAQASSDSLRAGKITQDGITELSDHIGSIESDIEDLETTIEIVESNRAKFSKIDDNELNSRKQYLASARNSLAKLQATLTLVQNQKKTATDRERLLGLGIKSRSERLEEAVQEDNDEFLRHASQKTAMIMRRQDEELEEVSTVTKELKHISLTIKDNLEVSNQTADALNAETDDTSARMRKAISQVNELLDKQSEGCNWSIIGIMAGLLFLLIILVFYL